MLFNAQRRALDNSIVIKLPKHFYFTLLGTPYWEIGAPMQYYISKMCATQEQCEEMHNQTIGLCDRIEWRDWFCAECCQGDRCNYYITLGSSSIRASLMVVLTSFLLAVIFNAVTS
ncbi:hypothetical protein Avbf_17513 [Armadillidium vulgare]|nr:hypothetical protein Avbf_17513 [Armadillidium vulgare]